MTIPLVQSLTLKCFRSLRDTVVNLDNPTFLDRPERRREEQLRRRLLLSGRSDGLPAAGCLRSPGRGRDGHPPQTSNRGRRPDLGMRVDLKDI